MFTNFPCTYIAEASYVTCLHGWTNVQVRRITVKTMGSTMVRFPCYTAEDNSFRAPIVNTPPRILVSNMAG